jgi:hypothetical protein
MKRLVITGEQQTKPQTSLSLTEPGEETAKQSPHVVGTHLKDWPRLHMGLRGNVGPRDYRKHRAISQKLVKPNSCVRYQ